MTYMEGDDGSITLLLRYGFMNVEKDIISNKLNVYGAGCIKNRRGEQNNNYQNALGSGGRTNTMAECDQPRNHDNLL